MTSVTNNTAAANSEKSLNAHLADLQEDLSMMRSRDLKGLVWKRGAMTTLS